MQAGMESHYNGGAFFPLGGSSSIAKTLVAAITRRGGHVFCGAPVERILTKEIRSDKYRAVGVRVHGVDLFVKRGVISNAGFKTTFGPHDHESDHHEPLVSSEASAKQLALIRDDKGSIPFKSSNAFFCLFVGLDGSDQELHLPGQNIWHLKDWNHDGNMSKLLSQLTVANALQEEPPFIFLSNESAKDPDYGKRHPGKSTVTMIAWTKPEWFQAWSEMPNGHRGEVYDNIKAQMTDILLNVLYVHFPKTKGRVEFKELGTPLSTNKYLGREYGEVYNLDHNVQRFDSVRAQLALHPDTTVKNLYLTGQDVLTVSVEGATLSGVFASGRVSMMVWVLFCLPLQWLSSTSGSSSPPKLRLPTMPSWYHVEKR
jgi:all-trans-retinol 13,14-reductase